MKKLLIIVILLLGWGMNAQTKAKLNTTEVTAVSMEVSVDSAEELKSAFKIEDLEELLEYSNNQSVSFKLICKGEPMSDGTKSFMSYEVSGSNENKEGFLNLVKRVRQAAIKYYQNK